MPRARPSGSGSPQPAFLRRGFEDASCPRVIAEQNASRNSQRILPRRVRHLVEEALDHEGGVRVADRAPPERRHAAAAPVPVHEHVRDRVGEVRRALDRGLVDAVLDDEPLERRAGHERLARRSAAARRPGCRPRRAPRAQRVVGARPVEAAAHVVLARPDHLDRRLRPPSRSAPPRGRSGRRSPRAGRSRRRGASCAAGPSRGRARSPAPPRTRSPVWNCVPAQTSQPSGRTSATQFSGSIVACAR